MTFPDCRAEASRSEASAVSAPIGDKLGPALVVALGLGWFVYQTIRDRSSDRARVFRQNPLAVGIAATIFGVAVGFSVPETADRV
jgi:hypothetical protein